MNPDIFNDNSTDPADVEARIHARRAHASAGLPPDQIPTAADHGLGCYLTNATGRYYLRCYNQKHLKGDTDQQTYQLLTAHHDKYPEYYRRLRETFGLDTEPGWLQREFAHDKPLPPPEPNQ